MFIEENSFLSHIMFSVLFNKYGEKSFVRERQQTNIIHTQTTNYRCNKILAMKFKFVLTLSLNYSKRKNLFII